MQRLLQADNLRNAFELVVLNISDTRPPTNVGKFDVGNIWLAFKHIIQGSLALVLRRPSLVYLNISQGVWGYIRDLGFVIPALLLRRKVVIHLRGSEFGSFYGAMPRVSRWFTRVVFKRVTRVIVLGSTLKHVFKGLVDDDRIDVIPNGINPELFGRVEGPNISNSGGKILFLSSLRKRKGLFQVIEAFREIAVRRPGAHLTLAGDWQDNEEKRDVLALIQAAGLAEHVTFAGEISGMQKVEMYKQNDIFVFTPIEPEGLPWVILEAMSAGLPVVTSDQGAIVEVVQDGQTGFIIDPDPMQIAAKVCYLLDHPAEARSMGVNGRRRVEQHFSESGYFKSMERVFHEALQE